MSQILFSIFQLGSLTLPNRIVMAPMTRNRSINNVPGELVARYYAQRAAVGLIITEGTSPSPNGLGYPRIPGIFRQEQVAGWRGVTDAVHRAGGRIFVQLMHTGRVGHPANLPAGARLLGPSAIAAPGEMYILSGGYDRDRAEADLAENKGDLVAFGRPFLANPSLVEKLRSGTELTPPDFSTFYTPGEKGYTDYPA
jgi:N-ethylmaleimide reductase